MMISESQRLLELALYDMSNFTQIDTLLNISCERNEGLEARSIILDMKKDYQSLGKSLAVTCNTFAKACFKIIQYHQYSKAFAEGNKPVKECLFYIPYCQAVAKEMLEYAMNLSKKIYILAHKSIKSLTAIPNEQGKLDEILKKITTFNNRQVKQQAVQDILDRYIFDENQGKEMTGDTKDLVSLISRINILKELPQPKTEDKMKEGQQIASLKIELQNLQTEDLTDITETVSRYRNEKVPKFFLEQMVHSMEVIIKTVTYATNLFNNIVKSWCLIQEQFQSLSNDLITTFDKPQVDLKDLLIQQLSQSELRWLGVAQVYYDINLALERGMKNSIPSFFGKRDQGVQQDISDSNNNNNNSNNNRN